MNWLQQIQEYKPYNEQEATDKELILKCNEAFDDLLTRDNTVAHISGSAFILNKTKDKALMAYHNIYDVWAWTGGHADGDTDMLEVAIKEAKEETGIKTVKPIITDIISLDVLPVKAHIKKGKFISSHLHLSLAYLLEADEDESLTIKPDENSGVKWLTFDEVIHYAAKEPQIQGVYAKIIERANQVKKTELNIEVLKTK